MSLNEHVSSTIHGVLQPIGIQEDEDDYLGNYEDLGIKEDNEEYIYDDDDYENDDFQENEQIESQKSQTGPEEKSPSPIQQVQQYADE